MLVSVRCFKNISLNLDLFKMAFQSSFDMKGASLARMYFFFIGTWLLNILKTGLSAILYIPIHTMLVLWLNLLDSLYHKRFPRVFVNTYIKMSYVKEVIIAFAMLVNDVFKRSRYLETEFLWGLSTPSNLKTFLFFSNWSQRKDFLYCIVIYIEINVMERPPKYTIEGHLLYRFYHTYTDWWNLLI